MAGRVGHREVGRGAAVWGEGCEVEVSYAASILGDARVGVVRGELAAKRMPRFIPKRRS
jgi:hypothetical protein